MLHSTLQQIVTPLCELTLMCKRPFPLIDTINYRGGGGGGGGRGPDDSLPPSSQKHNIIGKRNAESTVTSISKRKPYCCEERDFFLKIN